MGGEQILVIDDSPTITRMVQNVLSRAGYRVELAADGEVGLAAARHRRPDLILLDFVMPRMNGYQVCRELAADPGLASVPVVLMSARGDQVGERFVRMMGIVEYVTKPFSAERLGEVVTRVLGRERPAVASARPVLDDTIDSLDEPLPAGAPRLAAIARLRDELAALVAARLAAPEAAARQPTSPPAAGAGRAAIAAAVRASLDDVTLERLLDEAEAAGGGGDLHGNLRVIPLSEILRLLDEQELSGLLAVQRGNERIELHLRRGKVEQALGHGLAEELRLGRFVLDRELMDAARFDAFLQARSPGERLGQQLLAAGHLGEADLRTVLIRQSSELIYEALRWRAGRFRFRAGLELPATALEANLALPLEALIEEGCRRGDEWHLIERLIDSAEAVFVRDEPGGLRSRNVRLSREEQVVIELVDGRRRVADLVRASRQGAFEVSRALYRLVSLKLIRRASADDIAG